MPFVGAAVATTIVLHYGHLRTVNHHRCETGRFNWREEKKRCSRCRLTCASHYCTVHLIFIWLSVYSSSLFLFLFFGRCFAILQLLCANETKRHQNQTARRARVERITGADCNRSDLSRASICAIKREKWSKFMNLRRKSFAFEFRWKSNTDRGAFTFSESTQQQRG